VDPVAGLSWDLVVQALGALGVGALVVGAVSSSIRELAGGYWILGWAALLVAGACFAAEDAGHDPAGRLGFVADAFIAPLMLMGAMELHAASPRFHWPLLVGLAAGLARVAFDVLEWPVVLAVHGASIAPAGFVLAAWTTWRAPPAAVFRRPIAFLLAGLALLELVDAWNDWRSGENQIFWQAMVASCVPLAALQIASRLMALREGLVSARAASDEAEQARDLERWRFSALFDGAQEIVAELSADTRIHYVSERVREILGVDPEALPGKRAMDLVADDQRPVAEELWRKQLATGGLDEPVVFSMQRQDGAIVWLEVTMSMHTMGSETRWLVIARDVTERRHAEELLEENRKALEERVEESTEQLRASLHRLHEKERLAAVGTLASGIAHQINNPIGAISIAAEFALLSGRDGDAGDIHEEVLNRIVGESRRAGRIVRSLLRFARHGRTSKWSEDLRQVVRRSGEVARSVVEDLGGSLEIEAPSEVVPVTMSPLEIEQVVVNLVQNAAESRPDGAHVELRVRLAGDRAVLEVVDDGEGMSEETRARVFEPFFTTRLRQGGSGLGLSVVHGILLDHEAAISIESEPEQGTTVRVEFTLADVAPD